MGAFLQKGAFCKRGFYKEYLRIIDWCLKTAQPAKGNVAGLGLEAWVQEIRSWGVIAGIIMKCINFEYHGGRKNG